MPLLTLNETQFNKHRQLLIKFFRHHGDRRITKEAYDWIQKTPAPDLNKEGTLVMCHVVNQKILGVLIAANYGMDESFIAVHKQSRNQHIAQDMVEEALKKLGKLYGRVAMDNIPSLKVCLDNGMVAFHLFNGPTGKPSLWLGGGNWKKEDVL